MKTRFLIPVILLFGCSANFANKANEDFYWFLNKFYHNSDFQLERVVFPLPGENKQDMGVLDTIYYWEKENWRFLTFGDFDCPVTRCLTVNQEEGFVIEENTREGDPGFLFIRHFERREGKWFLIYMVEAL
jgi:hypothetical protein